MARRARRAAHAAAGAGGRPRLRRGDRRRRVHRPVGRLLPGAAPARPAHRRRRARDRRIRPVGAQRWLGLGGLAGERPATRACTARRGAPRRARHGRCGGGDRAGGREEGIDCGCCTAARCSWPPAPRRLRDCTPRSRAAIVRHGRGGPAAARAGRAGRRACTYAARARHRSRRTAAASIPARLARGLARACERLRRHDLRAHGAQAIEPGRVAARAASCSAGSVLRATEAYTVEQPGERRRFMPLYSLMVATEPLPAEVWASSAGTVARRSPICATCSSTRSAPPTTASRSAGAARLTDSARRSTRPRAQRRRARAPRADDRGALPGGRAARRSRTTGAGRSACRATGAARCTTTARRASAGRAATPGTASSRATCSAARSRTSCCGARASSCRCRGSATRARAGSRSRCASSPRARS